MTVFHPKVESFPWLYKTSWADLVCDMNGSISEKDKIVSLDKVPVFRKYIKKYHTKNQINSIIFKNSDSLETIGLNWLVQKNYSSVSVLIVFMFDDGLKLGIKTRYLDINYWKENNFSVDHNGPPYGLYENILLCTLKNQTISEHWIKIAWEAAKGFKNAVTDPQDLWLDSCMNDSYYFGQAITSGLDNHILTEGHIVISPNYASRILKFISSGFDINDKSNYNLFKVSEFNSFETSKQFLHGWDSLYKLVEKGWDPEILTLIFTDPSFSTDQWEEVAGDGYRASMALRAGFTLDELKKHSESGNSIDWKMVETVKNLVVL